LAQELIKLINGENSNNTDNKKEECLMAFVLKEAFRYQNFLESLIQSCDRYLRDSSNVMKVTEEHLRSKVVPEAQDEKKDNIADRPLAVSADTLISFMFRVYLEKESLSKAINDAKNQHCADMDMNMALNKTRQRIVDRLKSIAALKNRRTTNRGSAYCFNNDGNQVEYFYDIEITSMPEFNRSKVKKLIQDMASESDMISTRIDYYLSSVPVNFDPSFDINSSFEELAEEYSESVAA
jgi:hypothetical protein